MAGTVLGTVVVMVLGTALVTVMVTVVSTAVGTAVGTAASRAMDATLPALRRWRAARLGSWRWRAWSSTRNPRRWPLGLVLALSGFRMSMMPAPRARVESSHDGYRSRFEE